jgi:hypothetical protein
MTARQRQGVLSRERLLDAAEDPVATQGLGAGASPDRGAETLVRFLLAAIDAATGRSVRRAPRGTTDSPSGPGTDSRCVTSKESP